MCVLLYDAVSGSLPPPLLPGAVRARDQSNMSDSFLGAAELRRADSGLDASNPRSKVAVLSEQVVDSNPYSRLMCGLRQPTAPLSGC